MKYHIAYDFNLGVQGLDTPGIEISLEENPDWIIFFKQLKEVYNSNQAEKLSKISYLYDHLPCLDQDLKPYITLYFGFDDFEQEINKKSIITIIPVLLSSTQ